MPTALALLTLQIVKNVVGDVQKFRDAFIASVLSVLPKNSIGIPSYYFVFMSYFPAFHTLSSSHIHPPLFISTVRISEIKAVYDDGTIASSNSTSATRRLLLRTQIGVQVNYYVTTTQSQAVTMALLSQNKTRSAMATMLQETVPGAELSFPRFFDTVPPSFAPTPVPTMKPTAPILNYVGIVGVSVAGGLICLIGSIVIGFYSWKLKRQQDRTAKTPKIPIVYRTNHEIARPNNFTMPPSPPLEPGGVMDLEGGNHHVVFQRPRMFSGYNNNDNDEKVDDDDMDKASDLSSIAMSATEILTPMISSAPSSMFLLPSLTDLGHPQHEASGLFRDGDPSHALHPLQLLGQEQEQEQGHEQGWHPNTDNTHIQNDERNGGLDAAEALLIAKTVERVLCFKESEKSHHHTTNTNRQAQHRPSLPLPPPRVRSRQPSIAPPAAAIAGDDIPTYSIPPSILHKGTNIHGFLSQKNKDSFLRRGSQTGRAYASQASILSPVESQIQSHDTRESDKSKENDGEEEGGVWDDVSSVASQNHKEYEDLYLSAAYQQSGWEEDQGMILSTNPAWIKLLDHVNTEQEAD